VVQNSVEPRRRATATALLFFFLNLIALGGGPVFTGWLIDHLAQFHFNHARRRPRSSSLSGAFTGPGAASFAPSAPAAWRPRARPPSWPRPATAHGPATQQGIIVSLCFYAWAGLHYALAAIGMVKHMDDRAKAQA
jgi:MFS family permease